MVNLPPFPTSVIGSMPRPQYVKDLLAARTEVSGEPGPVLRRRSDDAVRFVIGLQEHAGIDIISDGEWRRETYIDVISDVLSGFEWVKRDVFGYHQVVTKKVAPKRRARKRAPVAPTGTPIEVIKGTSVSTKLM